MSGSLLAAISRGPAFARHETFHPRFGWLRKAVSAAASDPEVFQQDDATVRLGVGKNMVNAIRYWGLAYKVLETAPNEARPRMPLIVPSEFGLALLGDDGHDPWLEDAASLWLLHWKLLSPECAIPAWWVAFNAFPLRQFNDAQLVTRISELTEAAGWNSVVPASIKKDVDCLLRTYTVRKQGRQGLDDMLDCPFRELGLMQSVAAEEGRLWQFVAGEKASLPPLIVAYAAIDFAVQQGNASSISLARLAHDPGSPGCAFRLTEGALFDSLKQAADQLPFLELAQPAGVRQLLVEGDAAARAQECLSFHFERELAGGIA